jgi:hypothetical protein
MNEKQALEVIKSAVDLGVAKGNFQNLNETMTLIQAFNVIAKHFEEKKDDQNNAAN